ncbi:hypothetical protein LX16_0587 [Stackebrandtia albiflava]|uniref:Uncharacterized protein n=1 Tax=Stackebrandtia albiflava TaxID=406432 RepID=A0A562VAK5_9ACTN|nr:hypothetical protein [Stackebrandtia albiflava]TWJ14894.1 hypothetical protein LX16_0587 [Stackebrandtia albiflava]
MDNSKRNYLSLSRLHPPLLFVVALMGLLAVVSLAGVLFDDRILFGVPIWEKPLKFSLSFMLYGGVIAALIPLMTRHRRLAGAFGWVIAVSWLAEMGLITMQVVRGTSSHFNGATEFDGMVFTLMGVSIAVLWFANLGLAVLSWIYRFGDRAVTWSIRAGVVVSMAGALVGGMMIGPRDNLAEDMIGAHSVGVPDGGEVIPFLGWSATGGDLRIGHFVGLHALQVLPLLALWLGHRAARGSRWLADERSRLRVVGVATLAYVGLTVLVIWQAMRAEPLLRPSGLVIAAALGLVAATAAGVWWAVRTPRRSRALVSEGVTE